MLASKVVNSPSKKSAVAASATAAPDESSKSESEKADGAKVTPVAGSGTKRSDLAVSGSDLGAL